MQFKVYCNSLNMYVIRSGSKAKYTSSFDDGTTFVTDANGQFLVSGVYSGNLENYYKYTLIEIGGQASESPGESGADTRYYIKPLLIANNNSDLPVEKTTRGELQCYEFGPFTIER